MDTDTLNYIYMFLHFPCRIIYKTYDIGLKITHNCWDILSTICCYFLPKMIPEKHHFRSIVLHNVFPLLWNQLEKNKAGTSLGVGGVGVYTVCARPVCSLASTPSGWLPPPAWHCLLDFFHSWRPPVWGVMPSRERALSCPRHLSGTGSRRPPSTHGHFFDCLPSFPLLPHVSISSDINYCALNHCLWEEP